MIPVDRVDAVRRGMRDAFGVETFDAIAPVTGGHTASLVFRVEVRGTPYLLKIITRAEDPSRHYASMRAAAEAGIAPRVHYTDVEAHVSITDFVHAVPLPMREAQRQLPRVLRALQALPPFARAPFNTTCTFLLVPGPARDGFLDMFRASNLLPPEACASWFARHAELAAAYPNDDADQVASHNDLFKPDNIVFDGARIWMVDWEAAFLNNRYADLAVVANQIVTNDAESDVLLEAALGAPPNDRQRARLYLMQQLAHLFYAAAFLVTSRSGPPVDWSTPVPSFDAWQQQMWTDRLDLSDRDVKLTFARVNWERLMHNVAQVRYREAIRRVTTA